jgi:hypothetical protein
MTSCRQQQRDRPRGRWRCHGQDSVVHTYPAQTGPSDHCNPVALPRKTRGHKASGDRGKPSPAPFPHSTLHP